MTGQSPAEPYDLRFQPTARRAISHRLPESVAAAAIEFCVQTLTERPHQVGRPLRPPLLGYHGARRGTYRIIYKIDDDKRLIHVIDIDHRGDIYRRAAGLSSNDV